MTKKKRSTRPTPKAAPQNKPEHRKSNRIGLIMAALGFVGLAISAYLAYANYREVDTLCLPGMECDEVLSSPYAALLGVPVSLLGLGMYSGVVLLGIVMWRLPSARQRLVGLGAYVVALSATLWTLYLYYLELFVIRAFCTWCVFSSLVVFALLALSLVNLSALRRSSA